MCYIKSYSQLKEKKELKKEQLTYMKAKLYTDYYQFVYTTEKIRNGFDWWKKIMFGIEIYRQVKKICQYFRRQK